MTFYIWKLFIVPPSDTFRLAYRVSKALNKRKDMFHGKHKRTKSMEKILTGKRAESFIKAYKKSNHYTLFDAYNTYSKEKETAYTACLQEKLRNNGFLFKIVSHNTSKFTVGYLTDNIIQSQAEYNLHIITKENTYVMEYKL